MENPSQSFTKLMGFYLTPFDRLSKLSTQPTNENPSHLSTQLTSESSLIVENGKKNQEKGSVKT